MNLRVFCYKCLIFNIKAFVCLIWLGKDDYRIKLSPFQFFLDFIVVIIIDV